MKNTIKYILILFLFVKTAIAQIGIGTDQPHRSSALEIKSNKRGLLIPRVELEGIGSPNPISSPTNSLLVFNTKTNTLSGVGFYYWYNNQWETLSSENMGVLILNRANSYSSYPLKTSFNQFYNLPLNSSHAEIIDNSCYEIMGDGKIKIKRDGYYLISGELSTTNMYEGGIKYILALFKNNNRVAYLNRGYVNLPERDWWGVTGCIMYKLNKNDVIEIKYVINNRAKSGDTPQGTEIPGNFVNIGIKRL